MFCQVTEDVVQCPSIVIIVFSNASLIPFSIFDQGCSWSRNIFILVSWSDLQKTFLAQVFLFFFCVWFWYCCLMHLHWVLQEFLILDSQMIVLDCLYTFQFFIQSSHKMAPSCLLVEKRPELFHFFFCPPQSRVCFSFSLFDGLISLKSVYSFTKLLRDYALCINCISY